VLTLIYNLTLSTDLTPEIVAHFEELGSILARMTATTRKTAEFTRKSSKLANQLTKLAKNAHQHELIASSLHA
jgi:predicted transcriptional regulator